MKSWTHPETETVHSYLGAVISMVVLLLTIDHWTFDVAAFPLFIACMASVEVFLVGWEPGPRWRRSHGPCRLGGRARHTRVGRSRRPAW